MVMREVRSAGIDLGHRQAFDIVAAAGKQADDTGQHARLIVHQGGESVTFIALTCIGNLFGR